MRATQCCSHFSKKVIWLRKFWASCSEAARSILSVCEEQPRKGSAKFTSQMTFLRNSEIKNLTIPQAQTSDPTREA